jgi:site-specific DNA recombinase
LDGPRRTRSSLCQPHRHAKRGDRQRNRSVLHLSALNGSLYAERNGSTRDPFQPPKARAVEAARAEVAAKAVGYIRVSTDEQAASGYGLSTQEAAIKAFAASQGYELVDIISDPGISGASAPAKREGFGRVLEMAAAGTFSILLVYEFDRVARQIVHAVTAANDLQEQFGVQLRSVTEPIDTATPMGRMIFGVLASMAEAERQTITERTWSGRREKATRGGIASGPAPLGYKLDREGGIVPDDESAEIVRRIFAMRKAGATLTVIADTLNADGAKTARGGRWWPGTVRYVLDNPKYRGDIEFLFRYGGKEVHVMQAGKHAAIV